MKIYGISGLGADERVFSFLKLDHELIPISWIEPKTNESLENYSLRLSNAIDNSGDIALLGVSFGGLVAIEISKIINPQLTFLVSSAATKYEIRSIYRGLGRLGLLNNLPPNVFDPPRKITSFLFGTKHKKLLNDILEDANLTFTKWALNELMNWNNQIEIRNLIRIHGTKDKLIPWNGSVDAHLIEDGEHFMIVDKAESQCDCKR